MSSGFGVVFFFTLVDIISYEKYTVDFQRLLNPLMKHQLPADPAEDSNSNPALLSLFCILHQAATDLPVSVDLEPNFQMYNPVQTGLVPTLICLIGLQLTFECFR